ncbi:MAG: hypothetical protein IPH48_03785 [bacterium]|nr:hypothetical protein [bacterium]
MPPSRPRLVRPLRLLSMVALVLMPMAAGAAPAAAPVATPLNSGLAALDPAALFAGAVFDPAVPSLREVTGVEPAERPLRPDEVLAWFKALDEASPNAKLMEFGRTFEGRPLVLLAVSDPATIERLEDFRRGHVARLDSRADAPVIAAADAKAVAMLAYGIHGDELSSTDAACALAWWLVAGTDAKAEALRRDLVILIDPCENPDGRARYLAQVGSFAHQSANPDQDDLSHTGVWPWGRGNHYLFDLNRDWIPMRLPESARAREVAAWLPQLLVDSHEMGSDSSYLFPPARHPFNPLRPLTVKKWERAFSDEQAHALDVRGYPYFSGEWNEEFFPGYGSSWAAYHGGIGILYEMSRTTGTLVRKHDGTERTFAQAVEHQVISTLANLESLRSRKAEILADHRAARAEAVALGRQGAQRAWLFTPDARHPGRLPELAMILAAQGIEVQVLDGDKTIKATATDARTGQRDSRELPPGSLLVRLDQPAGLLARAVLDPHVPMDAAFFRDEREYLEKEKGSRLYDTTAWSLPLLRGVPAAWTGSVPAGDWRPWTAADATAPTPAAAPAGDWVSLIIDGDPDENSRVLAELLQSGVTVRAARKPFTVEGRSYAAGALVIRREGNLPDLDAVLAKLRNRAPMQAVGTSRVEAGPDLGGSEFDVLVAPRVGMLAGMPISSDDYGHIWHLFDQELGLRFSSLDAGRFARVDLSRYNVLVFPPVMGGVGMYRQVLGQGGLQRLRQWIEAGGTAIGLDGGARLLADSTLTLTASRFREQALELHPSPVWSIPAAMVEQAGRPAATGLRAAPTPKPGPEMAAAPTPDPTGRRASPYDVAPLLGPGAALFAAGVDQGTALGGAPKRMDEWLQDSLAAGRKGPEAEDRARADERLRRFMPQGALLRAQLDPEEWLGYGLDSEITVWFGADDALLAAPPATVAARFADIDRLHLGGLLWPEGAARLAHTAYATRENVGRGQVILFAGPPAWRRWMRDSERLLVNAVLLGPGLGTRWSTAW